MKIKNVNSGVTWDVKTDNPMIALVAIQDKYYRYAPYGPTLQPDGSYHLWGDYGPTQVFRVEVTSTRKKKIKHIEWMVTFAGNGRQTHEYYDAKSADDARAAAEHEYRAIYPVVQVIDVRQPVVPDDDIPQIKGKDGSLYNVPVLGNGLADWAKADADPVYSYYKRKSVEDAVDAALWERAESNRKRHWAYFKAMDLTRGLRRG